MPGSSAASGAEARQDVTESGLRLVLIVMGVMLAALMQTLDTTITNVALPNIQGNLGASQDEATWVVTAYTIAAIIVIPLTPWLQGRFGRKAYFLTSIVGFTVASMLCGWSANLDQLVVGRIVQGAFGGGLLATSQSILRDSFPPKQLGLSQGIFAIGAVMGPALGPPLGGFLVDNASWNWAFEINLVPGTIAFVLLFLLLRDPDPKRKLPIDAAGLALLAVMLGTLQYVLTEGERHDWLADPAIALSTAVCVVGFAAFVWWELFGTKTPIVDLRILATRSVAAGTVLSAVIGVAGLGSAYTLPQPHARTARLFALVERSAVPGPCVPDLACHAAAGVPRVEDRHAHVGRLRLPRRRRLQRHARLRDDVRLVVRHVRRAADPVGDRDRDTLHPALDRGSRCNHAGARAEGQRISQPRPAARRIGGDRRADGFRRPA
ncbi:MAG: transporter [Candidatus Eremiobacteraeota bacterium]|nr:transporter [Candidatus Eremiobacteraeota bacterium]